jgi:hypothetical protein
MKFINIPKELIEFNLPHNANLIFLDIVVAFFDLGYIEANSDIASKYEISSGTVSRLVKLLETNKLIFRFVRENGEYGIYRSRVLIPSKIGFQLLNIDTDEQL